MLIVFNVVIVSISFVIFFLGMKNISRRYLSRGKLEFCDCKAKSACSSFRAVLALMCKFSELCLMGQGLGYNLSLSHFGVGETAQHILIGQAYRVDRVLDIYVLTSTGRDRLSERPGSNVIVPALPMSLFDCVEMVSHSSE